MSFVTLKKDRLIILELNSKDCNNLIYNNLVVVKSHLHGIILKYNKLTETSERQIFAESYSKFILKCYMLYPLAKYLKSNKNYQNIFFWQILCLQYDGY